MKTFTKTLGIIALATSLMGLTAPATVAEASDWMPTDKELALLTTPQTRTLDDGRWVMDEPYMEEAFEGSEMPQTYRDHNYALLLHWTQTEIHA